MALDLKRPLRTLVAHCPVIILTERGPDILYPIVGYCQLSGSKEAYAIGQWTITGTPCPTNPIGTNYYIEQSPVIYTGYVQIWFNTRFHYNMHNMFIDIYRTAGEAELARGQRLKQGHILIKEEYIEFSPENHKKEQGADDKDCKNCVDPRCACPQRYSSCKCNCRRARGANSKS